MKKLDVVNLNEFGILQEAQAQEHNQLWAITQKESWNAQMVSKLLGKLLINYKLEDLEMNIYFNNIYKVFFFNIC